MAKKRSRKPHRVRAERAQALRARVVIAGNARYDAVDEPLIKKHARLVFWQDVAVAFGRDFLMQRFLVLASATAGDVGVLLGLGVPERQIVGVDLSPRAVQAAAARYPGVRFLCGDVFALAPTVPHDVALLDFCCQLDSKLLLSVERYLAECSPELFGYGVMRGREHPGNFFWQMLQEIRANETEGGRLLRGILDRHFPNLDSDTLRTVVTDLAFATAASERGVILIPRLSLRYRSRVPMTYTSFFCEKTSQKQAARGYLRAFVDAYHTMSENSNIVGSDGSVDECALRSELATSVDCTSPERGALLLSETKATLAAWKAVASRVGWTNRGGRERLQYALRCSQQGAPK